MGPVKSEEKVSSSSTWWGSRFCKRLQEKGMLYMNSRVWKNLSSLKNTWVSERNSKDWKKLEWNTALEISCTLGSYNLSHSRKWVPFILAVKFQSRLPSLNGKSNCNPQRSKTTIHNIHGKNQQESSDLTILKIGGWVHDTHNGMHGPMIITWWQNEWFPCHPSLVVERAQNQQTSISTFS